MRALDAALAIQRALRKRSSGKKLEVRVRIGIHTGRPTLTETGYVGIAVHTAARVCQAGHGGQILLSETTRALVGNDLPEGVSVHDLGEQNLKDIQHERVYELALDGRPTVPRKLKTQATDARVDAMAKRFEERVTSYVEGQLEAAFTRGEAPKVPYKLAAGGLGIAFLSLLLLVLLVGAIVLIVKLLV